MAMSRNGVDFNAGFAKPAFPTPQKTIGPLPGMPAPVPAMPQQPGMSWTDYSKNLEQFAGLNGGSLNTGHSNSEVMDTLTRAGQQAGFAGPSHLRSDFTGTSINEGGDSTYNATGYRVNPDLVNHLQDYRFERGAGGNEYSTGVFNPAGQNLGAFQEGKEESGAWKAFGGLTKAAVMAMMGGAASVAMGAGAAAGAGSGAFEGVGGAMASGGAPMTAAEFTAGLAGGGGSAATAAAGGDAWGATLADSLNGLGLENVGAVAGETGAAGIQPMTAAEFAQGANLSPVTQASVNSAALGPSGNLLGAGAGGAAGAYTTAAADSQAANATMQAAGTPTGAAIAPSAVDLGSLGGITSTSGGMMPDIAKALQGAGSSALAFAKKNPQLAATGLGGLATLVNGSGGSPPSVPGLGNGMAGGAGLGSTNLGADSPGLAKIDWSGIPGVQTSAGDPNAFNQAATDAAYSQQTRYLDPQMADQKRALESRLGEQGFVPGTPAYDQAMRTMMDSNARAYGSARDSSIMQGFQVGNQNFSNSATNVNLNNNAAREALAQIIQRRMQPLNESSSLKTNEQITYNNQLGQYNAKVASKNSDNQALSQLALALGMYVGG